MLFNFQFCVIEQNRRGPVLPDLYRQLGKMVWSGSTPWSEVSPMCITRMLISGRVRTWVNCAVGKYPQSSSLGCCCKSLVVEKQGNQTWISSVKIGEGRYWSIYVLLIHPKEVTSEGHLLYIPWLLLSMWYVRSSPMLHMVLPWSPTTATFSIPKWTWCWNTTQQRNM